MRPRKPKKNLAPILFDDTPRFVRPSIDCDLNETTLHTALLKLRPVVHARGYNSRPVEFKDCVVVASEYYRMRAEELQKKHKFRLQLVTPALLVTAFAWALVFGCDAYISAPNS